MRIKGFTLGLVAMALPLLASCTWFTDYSSQAKAANLEGAFLLSHLEAADMNAAYGHASRAAVQGTTITAGTLALPGSKTDSDYPELGQKSAYTGIATATAGVFEVKIVTTYGGGWIDGVRQSTTERYYLKDADASGTYNGPDQIVSDSSGATVSPFSRIELVTTYLTKAGKGDKSVTMTRKETIQKGQGSPDLGYASFAAAPLTYNWDYSPVLGTSGVNWSSEVSYTQEIPAGELSLSDTISSSSATFYLEGKRFYTEVGSATAHESSSLSMERVYDGPSVAGVPGGRLIATMVTRVSYTRTVVNGSSKPGESKVATRATYYLNSADPALVATKDGFSTSTPQL